MNTDNKKSGIRLRHLDQQTQEVVARDASPNNGNRKKIFDKNQRMKVHEKQSFEMPIKNKFPEQNSSQYEQLIQNLKKKTMEVEIRDETIKYLNKQIEDLKKQVKSKDREIAKLNQQIQFYQKTVINNAPKQKEQPVIPFNNNFEPNVFQPSSNYNHEKYDQNKSLEVRPGDRLSSFDRIPHFQDELSLGNVDFKSYVEKQSNEPQILSPFMALNNDRKQRHSFHSQITVKQSYPRQSRQQPHQRRESNNTSRLSSLNQNHHSSTQYSGFYKKNLNNVFDFSKDDFSSKKQAITDSVNKQLHKFNIFGENQSKNQIFARSKLQIEDSKQYKFQELQDKFDFGSNVIY